MRQEQVLDEGRKTVPPRW